MSLDVYLIDFPVTKKSSGIFVRENGQTKEISIAEWNARNSDSLANHQEFVIETNEVFSANITHNLNAMAAQAGIYDCLWNAQDRKASTIIEPLREGLHNLKIDPEKYMEHNPKNGWGSYEVLVEFVSNYLDACYKNPNATIKISK